MKNLTHFFKLFRLLVALLFISSQALAQVSATSAQHITDDQNSVTVFLSGNLSSAYSSTAGWTLTVGGAPVIITSVAGISGGNFVVITFAPSIGVGQAVRVNFTGDGAINPISNLASVNNRVISCSDFSWNGNFIDTPPCAPVTPINRMIFKITKGARNSSNFSFANLSLTVDWGTTPASNSSLNEYESDASGNPSANNYFVTFDAAPSGFSYPGNQDVCGYTSLWRINYGGLCPPTSTGQVFTYASFNTDAAGEGDGQLNLPPTVVNTDLVCLGNNVNMTFTDATNRNCAPDADGAGPIPVHDATRWVRVRYGYPNAGVGQNIPNVYVGGQQVTDAAGNILPGFITNGYIPLSANALGTPDANGVVIFPTPQPNDANRVLELITTTSPAGQVVGQVFNVTLEYWNQCNPYIFPSTANSRSIVNEVIIIDSPPAPVVPNRDICSGESRQISVDPVVPGLTYRWYSTLANAQNNTNVLATNPDFVPSNGQAPAGQSTNFFVTATLGNGCVSTPTQTTLRRRSGLSTAGLSIQGPSDLCPNSSYTFNVNNPPAAGNPGSLPTQYRWQIPAGWTISPVSGIGQSVTVTTDNSVGGKTLTVVYEYTNPTSNGTQCGVSFSRTNITVRDRPTTTITPDPIDYCEGGTVQLNGNPVLSFGTIASHAWTGATGILDATNVQQPNTLGAAAAGSYTVTYTITANFGGGVTCSNSDDITINISANPALATAGPDQNVCTSPPLVSTGLGANTPSAGVGTWSIITRPAASAATDANISNVNDPDAIFTGDVNGLYMLRWTIVNGACSSSDDIQLDFGTDPGPQDAGTDNSFCGLSGALNAVAPTVGSIEWSQAGGPGGSSTIFSSLTISNPTITVTDYGTYTYEYKVTSGTCLDQIATVDITFNEPATSTPMGSATLCLDSNALNPIALTGTVGGGATGGRWERVSGDGVIQSSSVAIGNTIIGTAINDAYVPTINDFTNGSVELRLVASGALAPCTEVNANVVISFDRLPTAVNAGANQEICENTASPGFSSTTLNATTVNFGGQGTWTASGAVSFSDVNDPVATVSNLPIGTTTLTWTVTSAGAICSPQVSTVDITVNPLPDAIDPAPADLCETTYGLGVALSADLTTYNDDVTGIANSTDRTIEWHTGPARNITTQITTPTSFNITNAQVLYTRVTNTVTNCVRDGDVTFTINSLPTANPVTLEFCEDFPAASNQVAGIDLTAASVISSVTSGQANTSVAWFLSQTGALNNNAGDLVPSPNNVSIIGNTSVFARVENTLTGCTNVSQVDLIIKPRPVQPFISGSDNQCTGAFGLYSVTPVAGATYQWSINPSFDLLAGGAASEFIAVLGFPTAVVGDVRLIIEVNGCQSLEAIRTVTVEATPPIPTILASKDPVCENDAGIVYSVTSVPNTVYTWALPGSTGTIISGQSSNQVTVNIGTLSGNIQVTPQTQGGACASSSPATLPIDVRPRPIMESYPIKEVCSDTDIEVTLVATAMSPVTNDFNIISVTIPPGLSPSSRAVANPVTSTEIFNDQYTNTTGGNLDVRYTVVPVSTVGCEGSSRDIFVRIKPEPTLSPNLNTTICSRNATNVTLVVANNSIAADQFQIVSIAANGLIAGGGNPQTGGGTFGASEILDDVWINTGTTAVGVVYTVRPINSVTGCVGDPPLPITITVNPEPSVTSSLLETICSGDAPTIPLTASIGNSTFNWTVQSIAGSITGATNGTGPQNSPINNILINPFSSQGSATYSIIPTGPATLGSCVGQPATMVVQVNPSPASTNVDQIVCSDVAGGNSFTVDLTSLNSSINSGGGLTFSWYQDLTLATPINAPQLNSYSLTNGIPVYVQIDNGQCLKVQPVTYTVNPTPSVAASITSNYNGFQLSCNGSSNGQITGAASNGTAPYLYSVDGGTSYFTSPIFNGLAAAGNPFVVNVRDSKGCVANSPPLNFVQPPVLLATPVITSNYNGTAITCQGAADGQITVTPSGGTGSGYTYQILELPSNTSGNANGVYTGLAAGSYTFVVKDNNNCQLTSNTIVITNPTAVSATATLTQPVSCNGLSDGEISISASGGTLVNPNYTFTLNQNPFTSNSTGVFGGLPAGSFSVTVRDDNACAGTSNTIIVIQPTSLSAFALATSNYNGSRISCPGANDAQITVSANGGNGGFSYTLIENPANVTGQTDGSFENLGPGSFTVEVRDSKNCLITTSPVLLNEPLPIVPAASITQAISCFGGSDGQITISGTGGTGAYNYTLLPSTSNGSGIFSNLSQGTYDFTISDLNGCSAPIQRALNQPTQVVASASVTSNYNGSQVSCNGYSDGIITITSSGGTGAFQYVFDQFALTNTSGVLSGVFNSIPVGNGYTFTVKDARNCTVITAPVNISEPMAVTVFGSVTSLYNGAQITCLGASDGEITASPSGGTGSSYTFVLNQSPSNTSGSNSGIYTGLPAGSYTITARDVNNCFAVSAPITISSPSVVGGSSSVTSNYNGRQITCFGASDGVVTVSPTGGVGGYSFVLNEIPGNTTGQTNGIFSGIPAGTYSITIQDANGCPKTTVPVTVSQPNLLEASAAVTSNYNGEQISCNGVSDGIIKITASGGTTAYSYVFNQIPGNTSGQTNGTFTGIPAGTSYSFTVTDVNSCNVVTVPISVSEPTPFTASALVTSNYNGVPISCNGVNDGVITVTTTGGTGVPTYVFDQFAATNQTGKFSGIFSSVPAGNGYTFTARDINNCASSTVAVDVVPPPALAASGIASSNYNGFNISCFNLTDGEITVTGSGGTGSLNYLVLEDPGNASGNASGIFNGLRAGNYRVRVTDVNNCALTTAIIPVTQPTDISISLAVTSNYNGFAISCFGASDGEVSVSTINGGAGGYEYVLDQIPTNTTGQNPPGIFMGIPSGVYSVTVTDDNNCVKQSIPVVLLDPLPLFEGIVGLDKSMCVGQDDPSAFTELAPVFGGIGNYAYQWLQSADNVSFSPVAGATSKIYDPPASLTQTTYYKRQVNSGSCTTLETNVVKVTVNPLPTATLTPSDSPVCEGEFFLLNFEFTGTAPFRFDYNDGTVFTNDRLGANTTPVPVLNYTDQKTFTLTKVRDFNGCLATTLPAPVTVPVIKINPNFVIIGPTAQCGGSTFTFQWNVDPDVEYTWYWNDGPAEVIPANSRTPGIQTISHVYTSVNPNANTTVPITLQAVNTVEGCGPKNGNQSITLYPNITLNVVPDKTEICSGETVRFTNSSSGGTSHRWYYTRQGMSDVFDERNRNSATTENFVMENTFPQNPIVYEMHYDVTNGNCSDSRTFPITVYKKITADFTIGTIPPFNGFTVVDITNTSNPIDDSQFDYAWDFGSSADPATQNGVGPFPVQYNSPGSKTIRLIVTNEVALAAGLSCTSTRTQSINIILPPLVASFDYDPLSACFPSNIRITNNSGSGADDFEWQLFFDNNSNPILVSKEVTPTFSIVNPGVYTIRLIARNTATNQTAFADNFATPINIYPKPTAAFQVFPRTVFLKDDLRVINGSFTSGTATGVEYRWNFGDTNTDIILNENDLDPTYSYLEEGRYIITLVVNEQHPGGVVCSDTAKTDVVARDAGQIQVPNAFTPNPAGPNDGTVNSDTPNNDVFLPIIKGNIKEFQMQIFDRWGNIVFESRDQKKGWNGYDRNGILLPAGVYVYKLNMLLENNKRATKLGDVTMIR